MTTKSVLPKILRGILHTEDEINIAMKRWELLNIKREADK
jgi:hypothetical protein